MAGRYRKGAGVGSLVFGFGGKDYGEWLIYIAKVTQKPQLALTIGRRNLKAARLHLRGSRWSARRKKRAIYHAYTDERVKDVGKKFRKAYVFLSRDFRYFGNNGKAITS
jgi:hypothetical protein